MEIRVNFDNRDRQYHIGDEVTGYVTLETDAESTFSGVWLTYRWRTHGRGNRDQSREMKLPLEDRELSMHPGQRREFPFRFPAPNGPVTYHGQWLNVDWYLTAHARFRYGPDTRTEEDFLLLPGGPGGSIMLGTQEVAAQDISPRTPYEPTYEHSYPRAQTMDRGSSRPGALWKRSLLWVSYLLVGLVFMALCENFSWFLKPERIVISLSTLAGLMLLVGGWVVFMTNAYKRMLEVSVLQIEPTTTYTGSAITCRLEFRARRAVFLQSIDAALTAQEQVTMAAGTSSVTEINVIAEKKYSRRYDEELPEGRTIAFRCGLPVDQDAPPSFTATSNSLKWNASLQVKLRRWPGLHRHAAITVVP